MKWNWYIRLKFRDRMPQSKGRFSLCSKHLLWVLGEVEVVVWIGIIFFMNYLYQGLCHIRCLFTINSSVTSRSCRWIEKNLSFRYSLISRNLDWYKTDFARLVIFPDPSFLHLISFYTFSQLTLLAGRSIKLQNFVDNV